MADFSTGRVFVDCQLKKQKRNTTKNYNCHNIKHTSLSQHRKLKQILKNK